MTRIPVTIALVVTLAIAAARASLPHSYAITNVRIVSGAGAVIDSGTVVIRHGVIEAVGAAVTAPADAQAIVGKGLTVYPGLIDLASHAGLDVPGAPAPQSPESREVTERWKRQQLVRANIVAADLLKADSPELLQAAAAGITSALVAPRGEVIAGQSSFINVLGPEEEPQVSGLADDRRAPLLLRTPVALHVAFPARTQGNAYPVSLLGTIAFVRQTFLDAQQYAIAQARPDAPRQYDAALAAMEPALGRKMPVALAATTPREIRRALAFAREFGLDAIIVGGHGAADVIDDLKAARARVIVGLDFPVRPKALAPEADESYEAVRARSEARKVAAALGAAGVPFAFGSAGLRDPKEFVRNVGVAVANGLSADAAVKALTLDAAAFVGLGSRLGSIDKGKIANLIVTDGDLFNEKTTIKHVFVDGRLKRVEPAAPARERRPGPTVE
jgi:imidazolonepropionase-like amidohydrolase